MLARWARLVGINLAILLAGVVIIELIFGNWIFGPHLGYLTITRDLKSHYDLNPVDPGAGIGTYTRDKHGLRGDYGGDPANIDMLVMGGSTTNELFVSDEKTWVAQLDKLLAQGGYKFKAINAGVDGHSSIAQGFDHQENVGRSEFRWLTCPFHRCFRAKRLDLFFVKSGYDQWCPDRSRRNGIDTYFFIRQISC